MSLPEKNSRAFRRAVFSLLALTLCALALATWLRFDPRTIPHPGEENIFPHLFARNEPLALAILAALLAFVLAAFSKNLRWNFAAFSFAKKNQNSRLVSFLIEHPVAVAAGVVFLLAAAGTQLVCYDYPLAMDEFLADFQAKIFLKGQLHAQLAAPWRDFANALSPTFTAYNFADHAWTAHYLPVYAAMRAAFTSVGLQSLANPFFAALSIVAIAGISRNIWPQEKSRAWLAAALLGTSAQFLITSMTAYSMPAHLCLNLIWLWLYTRQNTRRFFLAPWIGVLALGLHQPFVHALFVTPFLLRLVLQRKWKVSFYFAAVYLLGIGAWFAWWKINYPNLGGKSEEVFNLFNARTPLVQAMNLSLLISWQSFAVSTLVLLSFKQLKNAPPVVRDAAWSCLLTLAFYFFVAFDQGHGWGYRYFYGALGNFILLAVSGWKPLCDSIGEEKARAFVFTSIIAALAIQLPIRCAQVESFIAPFADANEFVHSQKARVVLIDCYESWYGSDFVRNDPFLRDTPKVMSLCHLTPAQVDKLSAISALNPVRLVRGTELAQFGIHTREEFLKKDSAANAAYVSNAHHDSR